MESSWLLLALISALALAIPFLSKTITNRRRRRPDRKLPPGPKPWPIIGNLNLVGSIPHRSLHQLSQKYGKIMLLKFGKFPVVVASSPEMAEQFLKVHDAVFASRPALAAGKHISYDYSDVSFAPYGPYWRETRKIFMSELLNTKKLDAFEPIRIQESRGFLSRLRSLSAATAPAPVVLRERAPVVLREQLMCFTLSIISKMIFTDEYSIVDMDELREMVDEWFFLNGAFVVGDWIPLLGFLDLQGYVKKMKALRKKMDRFSDHVIDDHIAKRGVEKEYLKKDFVDVLLQIAEDPNSEVGLTRDNVKALIMNFLLGGPDTSATTIEWAMCEILKHPCIIEKAKAELDSVIGRERWVEESDFTQLPYIDAIIKETFRFHPTATFLAPRYATEDCNVAGYHISKGTTVIVNMWTIGRDPNVWGPSAEEFLPERFLGKGIEMTGGDFALLPFGSGRRRCPGYNLGLKIVQTTLANLLHGFEMTLDEGMRPQDISLEEKYGLTTNPKHPLSIIMKPTLPHHLY